MTVQLRCFRAGRKPGLVLEALALRENVPYYWAGQPDTRPRRLQILGSWLLCLALALHFAWHGFPPAFYLVPLVMALAIPVLHAYDWYETEYVIGPRACLVKPGALHPRMLAEATLDFNACRIVQGRFLQRWTGCCNLVLFHQASPEAQTGEPQLVLHDLDLRQAGLLLDALQNNTRDSPPEDLVRRHAQRLSSLQ